MSPNFGPAQTRSRQGLPLVVNGVVVGPLEEEKEGTGIGRHVVKVQGKDLPTTSPLI